MPVLILIMAVSSQQDSPFLSVSSRVELALMSRPDSFLDEGLIVAPSSSGHWFVRDVRNSALL